MNVVKRFLAILSAICITLGLTGCTDKSWIIKCDYTTLPVGVYIYYLSTCYSEAKSKVENTSDVLNQEIDGKKSSEWIKDKAMEYCKKLIAIEKKFEDMKLSFTDDEAKAIQATTDSQWSQYKVMLESYGVSKDSFYRATTIFAVKYQRVFDAMYKEGGTDAVSKDDIKKYYKDNYTNYTYISNSTTKQDENGNTVFKEESEIKNIEEKFASYANSIKEGTSFEDIKKKYMSDFSLTEDPAVSNSEVIDDKNSLPTDVKEKLNSLKTGESAMVKSENTYYLIYRGDINNNISNLDNESESYSVLTKMKSDEFSQLLIKSADDMGLTINNASQNKYQPSLVANS